MKAPFFTFCLGCLLMLPLQASSAQIHGMHVSELEVAWVSPIGFPMQMDQVDAQIQHISAESRRWPRWLRRILGRRGSSGNRRPGGR